MCLYTTKRFPQKAEEDIKVYKLLRQVDAFYFCTPSMGMYISDNQIDGTIPIIPEKSFKGWLRDILGTKKIKDGYIHAFIDFHTAMMAKYAIDERDKPKCVIFECLIPKGTKVYFGDNHDICAKQMIIKKKAW